MTDNNKLIEGSGGKRGGRAAKEAKDTLISRAIVRVLEVLSEGPIEGIAGGGKGVYINDTPLLNADGKTNFERAEFDWRAGLPSQEYMPKFPNVQSVFTVGTDITTTNPVTRTTTADTVDAVGIVIGMLSGFYEQNTKNGDINGSLVEFEVDTKLTSSGTWVIYNRYTIEGKSAGPTEKQYRIPRPTGTGTWDIRLRRITEDSTSSAKQNTITLSRVVEIQDIKLEYENTAYVGLAIDAETVGNQIPKRSYLVKGLKVKIPTNYNAANGTYSGLWNGTFTTGWTDNPAWILYDLLTNTRYGMGEFITEAMIDKWSFYDAAVYNDGLVTTGTPTGTIQERRFTFNAVIMERTEAFRLLSLVAGAMRAQLIQRDGLITLIQDRPADPVKLVTKANVIDGMFNYRSSALTERHTSFNITFNDKKDRHLQRITTIDASTQSGVFKTALENAELRYGYNPTDLVAFGAVTEGQAIRFGRWAIDTELNQTEIVQFKMSLNGFDLMPGDIIKLYDEDYAATVGAGRIVSVSGTTVVLDREVAITLGSKIDVTLADGKTIEQRNISQTTGNHSTITTDSNFSQSVLEGADYIITSAVAPRQFKILALKQDEPNIITVEAVFHDPDKFARVEADVNLPSQTFVNTTVGLPTAPINLVFKEVNVTDNNSLVRKLLVSWSKPVQGIVNAYQFRWRRAGGEWTLVNPLRAVSYEIVPATPGVYDVQVYAINTTNQLSPPLAGSYEIKVDGLVASPLNAPTNLQVVGGGPTFTQNDCYFEWTNPLSNASVLNAQLQDFEVRIINPSNSSILRKINVAPIEAGGVQRYTYTYSMNLQDGGPLRTFNVEVRCRDQNNNLSSSVAATFTNPAPAALTGIFVVAGIGSVKITYNLPTDTDYRGTLVWRGTTANFTPSESNLVFDTTDNYISDTGVLSNTTYYYKLAPYDAFSKPLDGTGLNISSAISAVPLDTPGIPEVDTLPDPVGYTGPSLIYNKTDGKLWKYVNGNWQEYIEPINDILDGSVTIAKFASGLRPVEIVSTLPSTGNIEGRTVYLTADDKLYRWTGSAWTSAVPATDVTGQLTSSQIESLEASKLTGQVVASQVADGAINTAKFASGLRPVEIVSALPSTGNIKGRLVYLTTDDKIYRWTGSAWTASIPAVDITGQLSDSQLASISAAKLTGQITSTQITNDAITTPKIAAGAVTAAEIAADTITAAQIASGTITASKIAAGTITATQLAANSVTATQLAAGSVVAGKIAAGAIGATEIAADAITADKIATGAVTADAIAANAVTAGAIQAGAVTADKILSNSITALQIAAGAITADELAANAVTAGKIAANAVTAGTVAAGAIGADQIAAGAITTSKLAVRNNPGAALNSDPGTADITAWVLFSGSDGSIVTITDGQVGNTALRSATATSSWYNSQQIPVDPNKQYRISAWARRSVDANGRLYIGTALFDSSGTNITGAGTQWFYGAASNVVANTTWTRYSARFGAGTANPIPSTGKTMAAIVLLNHTGTAGWMQAQDVRIEEIIPADLIVDGSITATKIASETITSQQLAANSVIAGKIAAAAVTANEIASNAVTSAKIAADAVTADKINVIDLSAVSANISNAIVMDNNGVIRSGQTGFNTGTGFWISANNGSPRFSIGNSAGSRLTWDGSQVAIQGTLSIGSNPTVSGTSMVGSGAVLNNSGTFALGNSTTNISFNGTSMTMNGSWLNASNLVTGAISTTASNSGSGSSLSTLSLSIYIPSGARSIMVFAWFGGTYAYYSTGDPMSGGSGSWSRGIAEGRVSLSNVGTTEWNVGSLGWTQLNPVAQSPATITVERRVPPAPEGTTIYSPQFEGTLNVMVLVTNR